MSRAVKAKCSTHKQQRFYRAGSFVTAGNERQVLIPEGAVIAMHREPGRQKEQRPRAFIAKIAGNSCPRHKAEQAVRNLALVMTLLHTQLE